MDVADVAAAGALRDRPGERAGVRRAVVREGRDAGRHAGDVVHRGAGAGWALWRAFVKRDWRYGAVLVGYGAGFLPWFADIDRQMYFFYAATMAPFLVMVIAMILGDILQQAEPERRATNARADRRELLCRRLSITNFAWMYPILTGIPISQSTWNMQIWLPSWR